MVGLVDCNNFFVSCERIFNPRLRNVPVVVLSNNDGCIVALSDEAKSLGLKRGNPYFQVKKLCDAANVAVLSGNHHLYGDISSRVMATVESAAGSANVYSIDECFVDFDTADAEEYMAVGREIARRVRRDTGIPVSLGISTTKTLAKIASRFAKRYPAYRSVCAIDNEYRRRRALELTEIGDVWGIGRRMAKRLPEYGITRAIHLAYRPIEDIEKLFNVTGERTWRELNGEACIDTDNADTHERQQQMCCTRSFGTMLTTFEQLNETMALFSTIVARRLRRQHSAAAAINVFIRTNAHRNDLPQYYNSASLRLTEPTNDTMTLSALASEALRAIFRKGYSYKKAGILVTELTNDRHIQQSLFTDSHDRKRRQRLMSVVDALNASTVSHDRVHIAAYMPMESVVKSEHRSPYYSTRFSDIINVKTS